jgi:hypothetical protein
MNVKSPLVTLGILLALASISKGAPRVPAQNPLHRGTCALSMIRTRWMWSMADPSTRCW